MFTSPVTSGSGPPGRRFTGIKCIFSALVTENFPWRPVFRNSAVRVERVFEVVTERAPVAFKDFERTTRDCMESFLHAGGETVRADQFQTRRLPLHYRALPFRDDP